MKKIPLGISEYEEICQNYYYIDKTNIISHLARFPEGTSLLFTRPRRFGKSLMLSMLQAFFEQSDIDKTPLFLDKKIYENKGIIDNYFQNFPLIHLNLKDAIGSSYDDLIHKLREIISAEYERHVSLLKSEKLSEKEKTYFSSILNETASDLDFSSSLSKLAAFLYKDSGKKIIILIDEYDAPAHYAYQNGFYDRTILFLKQLFSSALKSNDSIRLAVLTGVLQIAKESLFSGLNNLVTNSILSTNMDEGFGFLEEETRDLLKYYGYIDKIDKLRDWYGNYHFGNVTVYNPLSVLSYIQNGGEFASYWNNTGDNSILGNIIEKINSSDYLLPLLNHQSISAPIDIALSYLDLDSNPANVLSFLLASGYLTIQNRLGDFLYFLSFPNKEIENVFHRVVSLRYIPHSDYPLLIDIKSAFENGDITKLKGFLEKYLLSSFSYYEIGKEKNYQIMLSVALSLIFKDYIIKNEVNAGTGRADILAYSPKGNMPAFIIETKALGSNTSQTRLKESALNAIKQIKEKEYIDELRPYSPSVTTLYGMAFYRKRAHIEIEQIH